MKFCAMNEVLRHEYCIVWQRLLGNVNQKLHCLLDDDEWLNGHLKSALSVENIVALAVLFIRIVCEQSLHIFATQYFILTDDLYGME